MIFLKSIYLTESTLHSRHRYAVSGKTSAASLTDSPVTIATAMLFDESAKLTH